MNNFYDKEGNPEYYKKYETEHLARIEWTIKHFKMQDWQYLRVADIGCGTGTLLNRLHPSNVMSGYDGTDVTKYLKRSFKYYQVDLNNLNYRFPDYSGIWRNAQDKITCFETLEHLGNLYGCVARIKEFGKLDCDIYLSIPHESVTHNTLYPALFYPETNFEQFLAQMALPIVEKVHCTASFPTWIYHCKNRKWAEKQLKWAKSDERFKDMDVLGVINN